eukprot:766673-Hanusia_phi.AAC.6
MALVAKRPRSPTGEDALVAKKSKGEEKEEHRTSALLAPIMLLQGHGGEVSCWRGILPLVGPWSPSVKEGCDGVTVCVCVVITRTRCCVIKGER